MNGVVACLLLLVVPGRPWDPTLDKTGTRGGIEVGGDSQLPKGQEPAAAGSIAAERKGFEPLIRI